MELEPSRGFVRRCENQIFKCVNIEQVDFEPVFYLKMPWNVLPIRYTL